MCFIAVVKYALSSVWKSHNRKSCYSEDLLREQALCFLFRGLYAKMDSELVATPNIGLIHTRSLEVLLREIGRFSPFTMKNCYDLYSKINIILWATI